MGMSAATWRRQYSWLALHGRGVLTVGSMMPEILLASWHLWCTGVSSFLSPTHLCGNLLHSQPLANYPLTALQIQFNSSRNQRRCWDLLCRLTHMPPPQGRTERCTVTVVCWAGGALCASQDLCRDGTSLDAETGPPRGGRSAHTLHGPREGVICCCSAKQISRGKGPDALTKGGAALPLRLPIRIYYDITLLIRQWKFSR